MTDKTSTTEQTAGKKAWKELELKQLDVPSSTYNGTTAMRNIQPGEMFNFYRNS